MDIAHATFASLRRCNNQVVKSSAHHCRELLSRLNYELAGRPWLQSMVYRQANSRKPILCGPSHEPVSLHVARFRREWHQALRDIASACPLVAESCEMLLRLDPLSKDSDAVVAREMARIRPVLSDPKLARRLWRERDREAFASWIATGRRDLGWSLRRLARECAAAARRIGFGVRAPDRHQLMDYERGRSNAHQRTRVVLATALGIELEKLEAGSC